MSEDISVGLRVQADTAELKQAIKDFRDGKIAVDELQAATEKTKASIVDQRRAISTLSGAQRLQNFQLLEVIRTVRTASTLFFQLNQVLQTNILSNIQQNQVTIAQREAFRDLIGETDDLVRALDILGPANADVEKAFDRLIQKADDLNSDQIKTLITRLEKVKESGGLSAEELQFLNGQLQTMQDLLQETLKEEEQKKFDDFFDLFIKLGATIGPLSVFVLKLEQMFGILTKLSPLAGTLARGGGIAGLILFLSQLAGGQTAGEKNLPSGFDVLKEPPPSGGPSDFFNRLGPPGQGVTISGNTIVLNNEADLLRWAQKIIDEIESRKGLRSR